MATIDLTDGSLAYVGADSIAALPAPQQFAYKIEGTLDMAKLIADGYTFAANDVFQLIEIPADTLVLAAGAKVTTAFDGTTPTVNIDFAAGDDIVDGFDVTSTGYCASGTNGGAGVTSQTTWTQEIATTYTIDVSVLAGASDVTTGVLVVYAICVDLASIGADAVDVDRDQLA